MHAALPRPRTQCMQFPSAFHFGMSQFAHP